MEIESAANGAARDAAPVRERSEDFSVELAACRHTLARLPADGPLKQLRNPIVQLAEGARRRGVSPERMIAELKGVLFRLPQFERRRAIERGDMMHQLITIAINAYYARNDD
jgi:hypothetical protein